MNDQIYKVFFTRVWVNYINRSYSPFSITVTMQTHQRFINVSNVQSINYLLFSFSSSSSSVVAVILFEYLSNTIMMLKQLICMPMEEIWRDKKWEGDDDWWFKWMASISENCIQNKRFSCEKWFIIVNDWLHLDDVTELTSIIEKIKFPSDSIPS